METGNFIEKFHQRLSNKLWKTIGPHQIMEIQAERRIAN